METLIFDGWKSVIRVILMCILAYPFLILLLRLFGKRTLSEISVFDFIITVTYGATLSSIITSDKISFADGAAILFMLTFLQYIVSRLSVNSKKFSDFIKASPTFLYHSNHFNEDLMKQKRLRIEDIRAKVRQQGISSFEKVEAIVLEGDGSISIVKKEDVELKDALDGIAEKKTKS